MHHDVIFARIERPVQREAGDRIARRQQIRRIKRFARVGQGDRDLKIAGVDLGVGEYVILFTLPCDEVHFRNAGELNVRTGRVDMLGDVQFPFAELRVRVDHAKRRGGGLRLCARFDRRADAERKTCDERQRQQREQDPQKQRVAHDGDIIVAADGHVARHALVRELRDAVNDLLALAARRKRTELLASRADLPADVEPARRVQRLHILALDIGNGKVCGRIVIRPARLARARIICMKQQGFCQVEYLRIR